jgi:aspartyl-tRNA(Asn)/glutamyl-tRNA(Gln) amidotransferase subunit A
LAGDVDATGKSALQIGSLLQSGLLDAEQVAEATLSAIDHYADKAVFTRVTAGRALTEARAASRRIRAGRPLGPLDGVPVAWKDLFDLEGIVTTAGSVVLADEAPAARDAGAVERLKAAGLISVGRVNMTEFAFSGLGINPHYGTPANPHGRDTPRIPGGSSSGSAVAVAAGLVPVSIGTDTGGSVRIPAAYNGIVGYKATRGRYPMEGVFPLSTSLDSLGVLCRTVADAVAVDTALLGGIASPVRRGTLAGQRLVVPTNVVFDDAEAEVVAAFEAALDRLAAAGCVVERRPVPAFDAILDLYRKHGALVTAEAYALHEARLGGTAAGRMDRRVVARARLGANITMPGYVALLAARGPLIRSIAETFGPGAVFAFPTLPHVAPPIADLEADDDLFVTINGRTLRNSMLGNYLDWCGVSLPCGTGAAGMPAGLLLSGLTGADEGILSLALAAEAVVRGES